MKYLTCDDYNGENTPDRDIDLRSSFINVRGNKLICFPPPFYSLQKYIINYLQVNEPLTYAPFVFGVGNDNKSFNGNSFMKFNVDISTITIKQNATTAVKSLGTWRAGFNESLQIQNNDEVQSLIPNRIYRVVAVAKAPFIMRDIKSPKGYKGYCIDMIDELAKILKFDYTIAEVTGGGEFGRMNNKGEWNGIVRKLIDKEADIGLGSMSIMNEREMVIDFTIPFYDFVGSGILMILPSTPSSLFKFYTVLETQVWLCILAAYCATSFLIWFFDRYSPYSYQNNLDKYKDDDERRVFTITECLWFCLLSLTPQGGGETPKNLSGRLVGKCHK
jgi:ionotropic glutamate receptor